MYVIMKQRIYLAVRLNATSVNYQTEQYHPTQKVCKILPLILKYSQDFQKISFILSFSQLGRYQKQPYFTYLHKYTLSMLPAIGCGLNGADSITQFTSSMGTSLRRYHLFKAQLCCVG
eukprot:TRINITY_DN11355_c0_g1_i2.p9 TRINITY_DN11355_c0_g1~~TRINITY_DN11355_c0_g1_i2.p9  ORF type:complete len:118 (+),score=1.39 TRINITY_DN11355_c0_g1_i2:1540-1893(+)